MAGCVFDLNPSDEENRGPGAALGLVAPQAVANVQLQLTPLQKGALGGQTHLA